MGFITTTSAPTRIAIAFTFSSSTLEGASSSSNYHNQKNPKTLVMKKKQQEEKRNKVVSFRMSQQEYARHLSMAKLCYENGVTERPDIVSFIRVSMECPAQYIISQTQGGRSAVIEQQKIEDERGGLLKDEQDLDYHAVTASSSRAAAVTNTAAMGEQHTRESIARTPPPAPLFNLHEYFQPVFDQLDILNKMLDSFIQEENDKWKEKKK